MKLPIARPIIFGLSGLLAATIPLGPAKAWYHSGGGGGGGWSHEGRYGGSASGGGGSWSATGARGGTASGSHSSWSASGYHGTTAYGGGYYHGYHPPTVVNHYGTGCYNCGGWHTGAAVAAGVTGLAVGAAVGAAAASAANAQPVYVMSDIYPSLPGGCVYTPAGGAAYYHCGPSWFTPYYGANGMYYRVVPGP